MMIGKTPKDELSARLERFIYEMGKAYDKWELCAVTGSMNIFYLTGTICDGLLLIRRGGGSVLWVRRSYDRSVLESEFPDIRPMRSFRDVADSAGALPDTLYLDMAAATMEWYGMLTKYMPFKNVLPVDKIILKARSVKSAYELDILRRAGSTISRLLRDELPAYLRAGISETELAMGLFTLFIKNGHHGLSRFSSRSSDMLVGHICFADSPLYPSVFNGASGIAGIGPATPVLGSPNSRLKAGDLVYIDIGFGMEGYHVDKTLVYSYMHPQPEHVLEAHANCLEIERFAASMLRPGVKPSDIYKAACALVKPELRNSFMGAPGRTVPFLGHSVGLYVDETPVLAAGFDEPLELNMTIAIEPKIGIPGTGMVGSENTYLVTESGGVCLTGSASDIVLCV